MPIFSSSHPPIEIPDRQSLWEYFFKSPASSISQNSPSTLAGYTNATTKERLSYREVADHAVSVSTALAARHGLKPGQTVALFSQNTIWYPVMLFAAVRLGAMVSGASPAYSVEEMAYALKTANARYLATSPDSLDVAVKAARNAGIPRSRIFLLEGEADGFTTIADLIKQGRQLDTVDSWQLPPGKSNKDVCAFLSFSSGTTGLPKAVMISHRNVMAQCLQIQPLTPPTHKKVLAVLPLFHITGLVHGLHLPILLNAEVIMLPAFTMPGMLQTVQDYKIEEMLVVPPILIRMVRDPIVDEYDLSCVKRFSSGAAPLSDEILHLLQKKFPGTGFKQGYGMTESCSCLTAHPPSHYAFKYAHYVGTIVASTELKIIDENGRGCDVGEPGEILGRGPQVVMGYLDNPKATRETFDADGWLHTGDQGVINEEGLVSITDRIKEMIKVKGIGVAPAELEDLMLGHEKIEDVAVLAIEDDYSGEAPKAFVVVKSGVIANESTGRKILDFVAKNKVRYKHLEQVEFIDEIPKSASGKILRRVLKERERTGTHGLVVQRPQRARL